VEGISVNDLWLFVEHGKNRTWTRADVPRGITTVRDMIGYLQRGGQVYSQWMELPARARFTPRPLGMTVIATLMEN
jgi:hypothetical protein